MGHFQNSLWEIQQNSVFVLLTGPDIVKNAEGNTLQKGICRTEVAEHGGIFSMCHHKTRFLN